MIFAISKFIANLFGLDISKVQRYVFWAVIILGLLAVLILVIGIKSCFTRSPKLNQEQITKAQQAIAKEDRKEMIEVLTESKVQEQGIDNSIKAAEEATDKAKRDYSKLSNEELAAELERRLNGE